MNLSMHINGVLGPHGLPGWEDAPADYVPCCAGAVHNGPRGCTCWREVYDLEQQPLADDGRPPAEIPTRAKCCGDCAYRNGSPECEAGETDDLIDIALSGGRREFWCHQGVRRVIAWRHPDGTELPAGEGDYRPPVGPEDRPAVWKADGTVGERCAGWAAHRARASREEAISA